ncbi:methyl-accepting chemotaxis sensory transducer with Cache sensor [Shimia marina]|uniref:Methyl-accepting chemotaxis protein 4 n=2 Tax=Shimia marina TaxID=321267 RepID=A0A0P1ET44_9RHOB|nr:Methyl-accepting chemotaxis protein 4 [Shimia marina]SFD69399.1 methyl-accepting chemotaxis sensory transducer with Cache sensor [Shimia marina]
MPAFLTKISARITALAVVALALSITLTVLMQNHMRNTAENMYNKGLLELTEAATSLLVNLEAGVQEGKYSLDTAQEMARDQLEALSYGQSGYMYAFDLDFTMRAHPHRPQWIGKSQQALEDVNGVKIFEEMKKVAVENGSGTVVYHFQKPDSDIQEAKVGFAYLYEPWGWIIGTGAYLSDIEAEMAKIRNKALVILAGILVVLATSAFFITRSVTGPMGALRTRMDNLAKGDTASDIPFTESKNELGEMARTLDVFKDALVRQKELEEHQKAAAAEQNTVVQTLSEHLSTLSKGDLTAKIDTTFPTAYEKLRTDFNDLLTNLSETLSDVVDAAKSINSGATEISHASDELSQRTEGQAATLEETAAALDDLTTSVKAAADGARTVETTMKEAKQEAEESGEVVRNAVDAMTEIENSSSHISQIISVIDDIAFQTNLLALNAGVEAARAGDAGRGFAVVASEVRKLAQSSSEAANEIKTLISDSSKHVERGVVLVGQTGTALTKIVDRVVHISQMVSDIAEGAAEQSLGLGEINSGVTQLDQVTQKNAAMVEEATAATHLLKSDATSMTDLVNHFTLDKRTAAKPTNATAPEVSEQDWHEDKAKDSSTKQKAQPAPKQPAVQKSVPIVTDGNAAEELWTDF